MWVAQLPVVEDLCQEVGAEVQPLQLLHRDGLMCLHILRLFAQHNQQASRHKNAQRMDVATVREL
jgi:hypothetical protein